MKKPRRETVAAIDVGSNFLRMMVAEITAEGKILPLEDVWKPTQIGRDTFASGVIEIQSIHTLCETLKGFQLLMKDYRVKHYHAVATSGIREAQNCEYVLDQIRVRTGLNVDIINNAEERFYEFKALRDNLANIPRMRHEGILIISIGMGGVEISVYSKGMLQFTEYVKVGSLRLMEILADLERLTLDFPRVIEEFLESKIYLLESLNRDMDIKNVIGLGGELSSILNLCRINKLTQEDNFLHRDVLEKMYARLRTMTTEQIISTYRLHRNEAEILVPSAIIFRRFLRSTKAGGIHVPNVSLRQGLLANMVDDWFDTIRKNDFINDIISSVRYLGQKFHFDEEHATQTENLALNIFDQIKRIHKLGDRARLYLQVAAILHDVGKSININHHHIHSYNIIRYREIMGFSNRELNITANIVRYHSEDSPHRYLENYRFMYKEDKLIVSKLTAILKLADALDISHKKQVKSLDITLSGRDICFNIGVHGDVLLKKWNFDNQSAFFEEVYGLKPILKCKG